jgi:predicted metallopeptidase
MSNGSASKGSNQNIPNKRDRLHQIHRWLIYTYGRKSKLRVEKLPKTEKECLGYVEIGSGTPLIRVSKFLSKSESIAVLIHEYCHVLSHYKHGPHWKRQYDGHDKKFYSILCEVENRYFYDGGNVESRDF